MIVWLDGTLAPAEEARISPFDHGLLTGDGVFETMRVYDGVPFAWTRHMARLRRSADAMGLPTPNGAWLREGADAVIRENDMDSARLRITLTGGIAPLGSSRGDGGTTAMIAAGPLGEIAPTIDVCVAPWPRNERGALAGIKTTSYGENVRALAYAEERGCGEAIFENLAGNLCEGTATNVFLVDGERITTPPLEAGCLAGVTRDLVLQLCGDLGIEAHVEDRRTRWLAEADEAFLTSTTREVQPIARVDGKPLPAVPGPVTEKLATAFKGLVARDKDP